MVGTTRRMRRIAALTFEGRLRLRRWKLAVHTCSCKRLVRTIPCVGWLDRQWDIVLQMLHLFTQRTDFLGLIVPLAVLVRWLVA